ncbi:MAG: endonuclease/exonuclease/phosphatase family protein [Candidatus Obscuribacter sp.]|nr:endonuclease/exonuclease/phosphatase family protein [Candidatus Obscuribacter sp.]
MAALAGLLLIAMDSLILKRRLLIAKLGAVSMLFVLVYCSYRVIPLWLRDDKAPSSVQMTLLHLNLAGERNKDYKTFFGQVTKENPDIVVVSESTPVWAKALAENLKARYPYFDKGFKSELAIYSKYPIVLSEIRQT